MLLGSTTDDDWLRHAMMRNSHLYSHPEHVDVLRGGIGHLKAECFAAPYEEIDPAEE
jgi:hypothetical protein